MTFFFLCDSVGFDCCISVRMFQTIAFAVVLALYMGKPFRRVAGVIEREKKPFRN